MNLRTLLHDAEPLTPPPAIEIAGLDYDSRRVGPGWVFFAFPGERTDGHRFVRQAREAGAAAVVSERPAPQEPAPDREAGPWVRVRHGRHALAAAALTFYERPDRRLALIGVTGTNGKTTTVALIDSILHADGRTTGRFGTIEHRVGERAQAALNTTPESLELVRWMAELVEIGGVNATLEASSHGLAIGRIYAMEFHTAVFTNLSRDHLDLHADMAAYARAKGLLFVGAGARPPRYGVVNVDDPAGRAILDQACGFEPIRYGIDSPQADVNGTELRADAAGLSLKVETPRGAIEIRSRLRGDFNAANILAAVGAALANGVDPDTIRAGIEHCESVPGRFETIEEGQRFLVVVDYAHTDDALRNLIRSARRMLGGRGRILTVFGCGGDRDPAKRPAMGEVAGRLSDHVILTSDNPRTEDPLQIIAGAEVGLKRAGAEYRIEPDRGKAIRQALFAARSGDIVLIAGKGHETYQLVGREKLPFDDRETARETLREIVGRGGAA